MSPEQQAALISQARKTMANAYVPVADFPVGAAVLTVTGEIYGGCNSQSVISGMGICAERSAIDHAVVHGAYCYEAIVVVTNLEQPVSPCGMCLQYIGEFSQVADADITILMVGSGGKIQRSSVRTLTHAIFGPNQLGLDLSPWQHTTHSGDEPS